MSVLEGSVVSMTIILIDPKFPHNVAAAVRAAANYGVPEVLFTGHRAQKVLDLLRRLPREERMRSFRDVHWERTDRPFDRLAPGVIPVAVEILPGAEALPWFEHPKDAAYVFGPEDGSLPKAVRAQCHQFVRIPMLHCANLGAAVYITLYDRQAKEQRGGS
jgi:tRNA(Leu) C34 or U34 (ribose-2'-O)-methylase TrmL